MSLTCESQEGVERAGKDVPLMIEDLWNENNPATLVAGGIRCSNGWTMAIRPITPRYMFGRGATSKSDDRAYSVAPLPYAARTARRQS